MKSKEIFIQEELRNDFKISQKRKKIWKTELDMLEKLESIAEKNNLNYFLIAGSAIGAVRHHGFIPWDDDIDIGMHRKDFNKFIELAKNEFKYPYYIQYGIQEDKQFSGLLRIRDSRTTGIIKNDRYSTGNGGIFIEIYPFDNAPDNKLLRRIIITISSLLYTGIYVKKYVYKASIKMKIVRNILRPIKIEQLWHAYNKICQICNNKTTSHVDTLALPVYAKEGIHYFKVDDIIKTILVDFEYTKARIAIGNDRCLKKQYGNYMKYPALNERENHHLNNIFYDPDKPYFEYFGNEELKKYFDE